MQAKGKPIKHSPETSIETEEIPAIIESGLNVLTEIKPRINALTDAECSKALDYLDNLDRCVQEAPHKTFDGRFERLLIQLVYECFISAAPGDLKAALLSVLASAVDVIGDKNFLVCNAFLEQLHVCLTSGAPSVSELAQWVLMRMVNCEQFYQLRPIEYWMDIVAHSSQFLFKAVLLAKMADRDPDAVGESRAPEIAGQLLVCLLNDPENIDTVRHAALGLKCLVYYFADCFQFNTVTEEIERQLPEICGIMLRTRTRKIFTMMECLVVKGIAGSFFSDRENVARWECAFCESLDAGDAKSVTRLIQLLAVFVRERIPVPPQVFEAAMRVASDSDFKTRYWAIKLICQYVAQFDCPRNMDTGFVPILLDMIMLPAMDLMKEMLETLYTLMDTYPGFMDMLINKWDEFGQFPDKLNEIEGQLDETQADIGEAIENIRHKVRRELPKSAHDMYV